MIGRSTCAITRSDDMQISHSGTPKLNILEIWSIFAQHRSLVDRQPLRIWTLYFMCVPYLPLPAPPPPPCNYEGMDMHRLATVLCLIWWEFHWNMVIYRSKCPILIRVYQTARSLSGLYKQGWLLQGRFQYDRAIYLSNYQVWPYAGQSQPGAKIEYSWNFNTCLTYIGVL